MRFTQTPPSLSVQDSLNGTSADPSDFGLLPSAIGLRDPGYLVVPHDPSDLKAGAISGYFDAGDPDPRVVELMATIRRRALADINSRAAPRP